MKKKTITDMSVEEYEDYLKTIPEHVSWRVRDAWLVLPPFMPGLGPIGQIETNEGYVCTPFFLLASFIR